MGKPLAINMGDTVKGLVILTMAVTGLRGRLQGSNPPVRMTCPHPAPLVIQRTGSPPFLPMLKIRLQFDAGLKMQSIHQLKIQFQD